MTFLNLSDLYNPDEITAILTNSDKFVTLGENQGFQETNGRWELWEKLSDGRLLKLKGWNKRAIVAVYK